MKRKHVSHAVFFKACETIRNQIEVIQKQCSSSRDVARFLSQALGETISENAASNALKAVGVVLEKKRSVIKAKGQNARVLANAVHKLYMRLGETPPESLVALVESLEGKVIANAAVNGTQQTASVMPTPVVQVKDPLLARIANSK